MKAIWVTDPHFDHIKDTTLLFKFFQDVENEKADCLLLGGDFAQADCLIEKLDLLNNNVDIPIYFSLGNHEYYYGAISTVRKMVDEYCAKNPKFTYLTNSDPIKLTDTVTLIGHDCWGDAYFGNPRSRVKLTDFKLIKDLKHLWPLPVLIDRLRELGQEAAVELDKKLQKAFENPDLKKIIVLTHVPPFKEISTYRGKVSDEDFLPFFSCGTVGRMLTEEMKTRPNHEMLVLSGHTHDKVEADILPNLKAKSGRAEYTQIYYEVINI